MFHYKHKEMINGNYRWDVLKDPLKKQTKDQAELVGLGVSLDGGDRRGEIQFLRFV